MITVSDVVLVAIIGGLFTLLSQWLTQRQNKEIARKLAEEKERENNNKKLETDGKYLADIGGAYKELLNGAVARITVLEGRLSTVEAERDKTERRLAEVERERDEFKAENQSLREEISKLRAEVAAMKNSVTQ